MNDPEKDVEALASAEDRIGEKIWVQVLNRIRWHPAVIAGVHDVPDLLSPLIHFRTVCPSPIELNAEQRARYMHDASSTRYDNFSKSRDYFYEEDSIVIRPRT